LTNTAVLGGTGFIGRALCRALAEQGHRVLAVARHGRPVGPDVAVRELDLATASVERITDLLAGDGIEVVVNAAGGMWGLTEDEMFAANVTLVDRLIEALCGWSGAAAPRLVQIGTVHEYGVTPIGTSLTEDTLADPVMPYGALKLRCTAAITAAARAGRIDAVTLRIGNIVGPGQPGTSLLGVVAGALHAADDAGTTAVLDLGPLGSLRDFVGLTDAVDAIVAAVTTPVSGHPVINIGRGTAASARDMVRLLIDASRVPTQLNEAPAAGPETTWQQMDITLASDVLRWSPIHELSKEMKELWEHQVRV
jgi:dTDP-6-deoxy-L-talose 4-dehydrogenase [NAD(P)+]